MVALLAYNYPKIFCNMLFYSSIIQEAKSRTEASHKARGA